MLLTISDLRNNRERPAEGGGARARAKVLHDWVYSADSKRGGYSSSDATLPVRLATLLAPQSAKKGLWWMEARLEGGSMDRRKEQEHATAPGDADDVEMSADLMALARKMRMSTDVRKAVFCAVMGAEDYVDAGHRLAKLTPQLKPPQDREIVRVIFECCTQEAEYNPYYAAVLRTVCGAHGGGNHAYTLRFSFWDMLKEADGMPRRKIENAAQLLVSLLVDKSPRVGWDCIKPVEWLALKDHPCVPPAALLLCPCCLAVSPRCACGWLRSGQRLFLRTLCAELLASPRSKAAIGALVERADLATAREGLAMFAQSLPAQLAEALQALLPSAFGVATAG